MKHLVLDTGIYRKVPRLDSPEFKALSYLSRKGCVKIHVPYIVEREFSTQLEQDQRKRILGAINSLKAAVNYTPLGEKSVEIPGIIKIMEQNIDALISERSAAFISWIQENNGQRHALSIEETHSALEAYFSGHPPLKEPKIRKDIPDAFIFQCVLSLNTNYLGALSVIVEDRALSGACNKIGIEVFCSISDFLASDAAQEYLAEKIIDDNLDIVIKKVQDVADASESEIAEAIEEDLLGDDYRLLYGEDLPGESNEIYVSGVSKPHEVELHAFEYLGAGVFICPFTAIVELVYEYAVYISESFDLDREKFFIEPLNDHYVNVETTDEFEFTGRVELDFGEDILDCETIEELLDSIENPSISADGFEDFHVLYEDM